MATTSTVRTSTIPTTEASSTSNVIIYLLAILLPPVSVFLKTGLSVDFIINILLCILGWIPGILHAWWVISRHDPAKVVVAA